MPILTVEIVTRADEAPPRDLSKQIAQRAGKVFNSEPGGTWVRLVPIESERYAEGPGEAAAPMYPVFVSVLKRQIPSPSDLEREISLLTNAVAEICGRSPENVHITYLPGAAGRMAFGGKLVRP